MFAVCIEINTVEIKCSLTYTSVRLMPNAIKRAVRKRDWTVEICRRSDSVYRWKLWLWDVSLSNLTVVAPKIKIRFVLCAKLCYTLSQSQSSWISYKTFSFLLLSYKFCFGRKACARRALFIVSYYNFGVF